MAAAKSKPAKGAGGKKKLALHARMPVKRSINLVLIDENKASAAKAIPGILAIVVLAALFSKFLVADRLVAASRASGQLATLRGNLASAMELLDTFDDVEDKYAHYTYAGMTQQELNLVDRPQVVELVSSVLPAGNLVYGLDDMRIRFASLFRALAAAREDWSKLDGFRAELATLREPVPLEDSTNSWSVSDNVLTLDVASSSLERMNVIARRMEDSPIVNSCLISTANKDARPDASGVVHARFIVYLQQPPEPEEGVEP